MSKFSPTEEIKFGWKIYKENFGELWAVYIVVFLVALIPSLISLVLGLVSTSVGSDLTQVFGGMSGLLSLAGWVLSIVVTLGVLRVQLDLVDGKKVQIADVFSEWKKGLWYFLGSLLTGVIVALGLILLIIPGIIFGIKLQFFNYAIVDKNLGPIAAIKKSWQMTNGVTGDLFIFGLLLFGMNLLAVIFLFVGLVVTVPVSALALASVYRKLSKSS